MNIEIGNKPIDFVFQGDELIYPNYAAKENLVLHYDFSGRTNLDVKKGIAEDLSGNGNDGVLNNFAYVAGSGYVEDALESDGVDDELTMPDEFKFDSTNFTLEFVFNAIESVGANQIFAFLGSWSASIRLASRTLLRIYVGGDINNFLIGVQNLLQRSLISIVFDNVNKRILCYQNGVLIHTEEIDSVIVSQTGRHTMFFQQSGYVFKYNLGSVRKYNKALTPSEIAQNYAIDKKRFNIIG